jgi:hypothetical protein
MASQVGSAAPLHSMSDKVRTTGTLQQNPALGGICLSLLAGGQE